MALPEKFSEFLAYLHYRVPKNQETVSAEGFSIVPQSTLKPASEETGLL